MTDTNPYAGLTDSELDAAYSAYYDAHDAVDAGVLADEIIQRLASPLSFAEGLFGVSRFPMYTARQQNVTGFNQVQTAQSAAASSAAAVGTTIKNGVASIASKIGVGTGVLIGAAVLAVAAFVYFKTKK